MGFDISISSKQGKTLNATNVIEIRIVSTLESQSYYSIADVPIDDNFTYIFVSDGSLLSVRGEDILVIEQS